MDALTKFLFSLVLTALSLGATNSWAAADDSDQQQQTPANQNDVQVEKTPPKAAVTGVRSQPAGAPQRGGALDPSQQSSMGLGIQIPISPKSPESKDSRDSKDNDDE